MSAWENEVVETLTKEEAIAQIKEDSMAKGYVNYKVFYDGKEVVRPSDLPDAVDYSKIEISAVMDQASL